MSSTSTSTADRGGPSPTAEVAGARPRVARCAHGDLAALVSATPGAAARARERSARPLAGARGGVAAHDDRAARPLRHRDGATTQAVVDEFLAPRTTSSSPSCWPSSTARSSSPSRAPTTRMRCCASVVERIARRSRAARARRGLPEAAAYYDADPARRARRRRGRATRERDAARVLERLEPLAVATSRERRRAADGAVNAAFLVERDRVDAFERRRRGARARARRRGSAALSRPAAAVQLRGRADRGGRHGPDHRPADAAARARSRHGLARRALLEQAEARVLRRGARSSASCSSIEAARDGGRDRPTRTLAGRGRAARAPDGAGADTEGDGRRQNDEQRAGSGELAPRRAGARPRRRRSRS